MTNQYFDLRWWLLNHLVDIQQLLGLYKSLVIICFLGFISLSLLPLIPRVQKSKFKKFLMSDIIFVISIIVFILSARWPGLLAPALNPDESLFIATAMKLL